MTWTEFLGLFGGAPVYLPQRDAPEPPLFVLGENEISLAEPLYNKIVPVLDKIGVTNLVDLLMINGVSLFDVLQSVVMTFKLYGVTISTPILLLCITIAGYISDKLKKNVHRSVGGEPTAETAYEILAEYFGTNLIF